MYTSTNTHTYTYTYIYTYSDCFSCFSRSYLRKDMQDRRADVGQLPSRSQSGHIQDCVELLHAYDMGNKIEFFVNSILSVCLPLKTHDQSLSSNIQEVTKA
jgi:hypothetical protein